MLNPTTQPASTAAAAQPAVGEPGLVSVHPAAPTGEPAAAAAQPDQPHGNDTAAPAREPFDGDAQPHPPDGIAAATPTGEPSAAAAMPAAGPAAEEPATTAPAEGMEALIENSVGTTWVTRVRQTAIDPLSRPNIGTLRFRPMLYFVGDGSAHSAAPRGPLRFYDPPRDV